MKILAIVAQKGGVSKTTIATCLAVEAVRQGLRVLVIDLDPQATATFWSDLRQDPEPDVISIQPVRLPAALKAAEEAGADLVIIDTPPTSRDIAYTAADVANFVLVPFAPKIFDVKAIANTVQIVKQTGTPYALVGSLVPPQGNETTEAQDITTNDLDSDFCPVTLGNRKAYYRAQAKGCAAQEGAFDPDGKATEEIKGLYSYTCIHLYKNEGAAKDVRKLA